MNRVGTVIYLLFRTAVRGLVSSAMTSVAAIVTIAITLTLLGAFALLVGNMRGMLDRFGGEIEMSLPFGELIRPYETWYLVNRRGDRVELVDV